MHKRLLDALIETVHEDDVPMNITTGASSVDCNGDRQVDVLLEYDDKDAALINAVISNTINIAFGLI